MLTVILDEAPDAFYKIMRFYVPKGSRVLDITYGHGKLWASCPKDYYELVTNDVDPNSKAEYHLPFINLEAIPGSFHCVVYDPPYKYDTPSYKLYESIDEDWTTVKTKWTIEDQINSARVLNSVLPRMMYPNGLLIVKIMDTRYKGKLILNHKILIDEFSNFEVKDLLVYIRLLVGLFRNTRVAQTAHGYYIVFKLKEAL